MHVSLSHGRLNALALLSIVAQLFQETIYDDISEGFADQSQEKEIFNITNISFTLYNITNISFIFIIYVIKVYYLLIQHVY